MTPPVTPSLPSSRSRVTGIAGVAGVLGTAVLWGTVGPAQALASSSSNPGALGVACLLLGELVLAAFCVRGSAWKQVFRREAIGWVLPAAAATGVYQITFMHAVDQISAAPGTTITLGVAPIAIGLCARWWMQERLTFGWVSRRP